MKKLLMILAFLLFLSIPVFAESYTCTDTNTSHFETTITVDENPIPVSYDESCNFGCSNTTGMCQEREVDIGSIGVMIGLIGLAFLFVYLARNSAFSMKIGEFEFDPLQLLFFFMALFMVMIDFSIFMRVSEIASQSGISGSLIGGYTAIMYGYYAILFFFFIYFFYVVIKTILEFAKKHSKV